MEKINVVQLGANAGDDHVTNFIDQYHHEINKALLVEPISSVADECRQFYKNRGDTNVVVHAAAISNKNGTADLTYIPGSNLRLSSLIPNVHTDFRNPVTTTMSVSTLTMKSLLAKHDLNVVDVLFVDTEGYDEDILINYDFKKYNTNYIVWEHSHAIRRNKTQHDKLIQKLMDGGFIIENRGANKLATKIGTKQYKTTLQ